MLGLATFGDGLALLPFDVRVRCDRGAVFLPTLERFQRRGIDVPVRPLPLPCPLRDRGFRGVHGLGR